MTMYPECAATPEEDGPNFVAPTMGEMMKPGLKRLREADAFKKVSREAANFHERKARSYGVDSAAGIAHFKASRAYRSQEAAGQLQEMFDSGDGQQLDPKGCMKAHKSAIQFHKKAAQKAGLDSDEGQAHVQALQNHLQGLKQAKQQAQPPKESTSGLSGKQNPVPVPKKSDQPNGDIRQQKPAVPIEQLQGGKESRKAAIKNFGRKREGADCVKSALPSTPHEQKGKNEIYVGEKPKGFRGPLAAEPKIHGSSFKQESRRSLRRGRPR